MNATCILLATWATASVAWGVESAIPSAFPPDRYQQMVEKSPFALATPVEAPAVAPDKTFADGWFVSGLAHLDGKDFVTIKARDLSVQFSLFGNEANDNGVKLVKVSWSPSVGRSTATIEKDGQSAVLEFNQAEVSATPPAAPPTAMAAPSAPGRPGGPQMANRPGIPRPQQPIAQPQPYGIVPPRPGQPQQQPALRQGNVPVPGQDTRRRIRVINSGTNQ